MPFYRTLVEERNKSGVPVQLVGACDQPIDVCKNYWAANQLKLDQIVSLSLDNLKLRSTPTLLLLGRDGRVQDSWVGRLPSADESAIVKTLAARDR